MRAPRLLLPLLLLSLSLGAAAARASLPPRYDFTLRVATGATIATLDPCRARTWAERDLVAQLFEGVVIRTADGIRPALAADWQASADSLTWTFRLAGDRTFGDGTPVRASDVVTSWRRVDKAAPEWNWLFDGWDIAAADSLTVRLTLPRPVDDLLERLALPVADVVREVTSGGARSLSGAGPFRFAGRDPDGFILAPRLDDPRGRPFAGRVLVRPVESAAELKALWQTGGAAIMDGAPFGGRAFDAVTRERAAPTAWLVIANPARAAFGAHLLRAAFDAVLDRDALAAGLTGAGVVALPRLEALWAPPGGSNPRTAPARKRGAATTATATIVVDQSDPVAVALGEDLVRPLADIGLSGAPKPMAASAWRQALTAGDYDLLILRWDAPASRAALALPELLFRPEITRLAPAGAPLPTEPASRLGVLAGEHLLLPLVRRSETVIARSDLVGLALDPLAGTLRLADVWPTVRDQP